MKGHLLPAFAAMLLWSGMTAAAPADAIPTTDQEVRETLRAMADASTWGHPDQFGQFGGMRRYAAGDYADALSYFRIGARYADKLSQLCIGLMYLNGQGVPRDPVLAYAWVATSAERDYPQFVATRDRIWRNLDPAQKARAKDALAKIQGEYGDKVAKRRMNNELAYWRSQMTGSRTGFNSGVKHLDKAMLEGGVPNAACSRRTVGGAPVAGCGGEVYAAWRWDPKQYYRVVDAGWRGTVTVGELEQVPAPDKAAHDSAPPTDK